MLSKRLRESENVKAIAVFEDGLALWNVCKQKKLEGMVCKRQNSLYRVGQRSKDWLKVKFTESDTFVIVGYNRDEGFLVADRVSETPVIVGNVEFGFSERNYTELLSALRPAEADYGRRKRRETIWFQQEVWIKVEYMERTSNGVLRAPVFRGLSVRDD